MITCRLKRAALTAIILTTVLDAEAVSARRHRPEVKNPTEQRTRSESRIAREARSPVPLPRPRPTEAPPTPLPSLPSHDQACLDRLTAAGFEFQVAVLTPFPQVTETRCDKAVEGRERLGGLLRYYHGDAA
jgi:hypothetical protein